MKSFAAGNVSDSLVIIGNIGYPGYVLRGTEKNLMIDCGLNWLGPLYLESITRIFPDPTKLEFLFLTHSHYDHLGAAPFLKRSLPHLKIGGSGRIAELLGKPSVIERMNRLSAGHQKQFETIAAHHDVHIEAIPVDLNLKEGDRFDLGGMSCQVYETPGHTGDSLSFYFPETGALFAGEAVGVPLGMDGSGVHVQFLSSYTDYRNSLEKLVALNPKILGMAHGWIFTDEDVTQYLKLSLAETENYRKTIEAYLDAAHGDVEKTIALMVQKEYDEKGTILQERNAYIANLTAQVKLITAR